MITAHHPVDEVREATSGFVDADALRLHHHVLGDGAPTVFLHGGGPGCTSWSDFRHVAHELSGTRRCHLLDLPQHGRSDKPTISGGRFTFHMSALLRYLDALGLDAVDLVCQSLGSAAALALAAAHPERVRRLVLTASQPFGPPARIAAPQQGWAGRRAREEYYGGSGPSPEKMRTLMARYEWYDESLMPAETVRLRYEASADERVRELALDPKSRGITESLLDRLELNRAPTLITCGAHDVFGGIEAALTMLNAFVDARLYVMPRTAHHLQEEIPALYARFVQEFLDN